MALFRKFRNVSLKKRFLIPMLLFPFAISLLAIMAIFIYSSFTFDPQEVKVSNVTPYSATISWVTKARTKGVAITLEEPTRLPLVFDLTRGNKHYDDRDWSKAELRAIENSSGSNDVVAPVTDKEIIESIFIPNLGDYNVHHVTLRDLEPGTEYYLMLGNGGIYKKLKFSTGIETITTLTDDGDLSTPEPAYGQVKMWGTEEPITDGVVYLEIEDRNSTSRSTRISSALSEEGSWYLDLTTARNADGEPFLASTSSDNIEHLLTIETGEFGRFSRYVPLYNDAPVETIYIGQEESRKNSDYELKYLGNSTTGDDPLLSALMSVALAADCGETGGTRPCSKCKPSSGCDQGVTYGANGEEWGPGYMGYCRDKNCKKDDPDQKTPDGGDCECGCAGGPENCPSGSNKTCKDHKCVDKNPPPKEEPAKDAPAAAPAACEGYGDGKKSWELSGTGSQKCPNEDTCPCHCATDPSVTCAAGATCNCPASSGTEVCCHHTDGTYHWENQSQCFSQDYQIVDTGYCAEAATPKDVGPVTNCNGKSNGTACTKDGQTGTCQNGQCNITEDDDPEPVTDCSDERNETVCIRDGRRGICSNGTCELPPQSSGSVCCMEVSVSGSTGYTWKNRDQCVNGSGGYPVRTPTRTTHTQSSCEALNSSRDVPVVKICCRVTNAGGSSNYQWIARDRCNSAAGEYPVLTPDWSASTQSACEEKNETPVAEAEPTEGATCSEYQSYVEAKSNRYCSSDCNGQCSDTQRCVPKKVWISVPENNSVYLYIVDGYRCRSYARPSYHGNVYDTRQECERVCYANAYYSEECVDIHNEKVRTLNGDETRKGYCLHAGYRCTYDAATNKTTIISDQHKCVNTLITSTEKSLLVKPAYAQEEQGDDDSQVIYSPESGSYAFPEGEGNYLFLYENEYYLVKITDSTQEYIVFIDENDDSIYEEQVDTALAYNPIELEFDLGETLHTYSLKKGYNFLSFDFIPESIDPTSEGLLEYLTEEYGDVVYSVSKYSPSEGGWRILGSRNGQIYGTELFQISPGIGYVIRAAQDVDIAIPGYQVDISVPIVLNEGWNLVAFHGGSGTYTAESFLTDVKENDFIADNVSRWQSSTGRYNGFQMTTDNNGVEQVYGYDFPLDEQQAYFVRVLQGEGRWTPE